MTYSIGYDAIHLRPTPRIAHTEYCSNAALIRHLKETTGLGFDDAFDIDFIWSTHDGPEPWHTRGRTTDMGHAEFLEGGTDYRLPKPSPFQSAEDVWAFDAVKEYGLTDFDKLVRFYEETWQQTQRRCVNQVFPGGYYNTIVSGAIAAFGWDALLEAAADQDRFAKVLDSIYRQSMHHIQAWARTSAPIFISHDDMVWTEGPFMDPAFYRRVIFPRYRSLWKVLRDAGKKVLFCSDATWTEFLPDIAEAGADGFIFEPSTSLERAVELFGRTHVIMASKVDCRTLTFGTREQIKAEIDASLRIAGDCPGFVFAVGNHIPSNVPVENAMFYLEYLRANWRR